jgi:hypothetical protein
MSTETFDIAASYKQRKRVLEAQRNSNNTQQLEWCYQIADAFPFLVDDSGETARSQFEKGFDSAFVILPSLPDSASCEGLAKLLISTLQQKGWPVIVINLNIEQSYLRVYFRPE